MYVNYSIKLDKNKTEEKKSVLISMLAGLKITLILPVKKNFIYDINR